MKVRHPTWEPLRRSGHHIVPIKSIGEVRRPLIRTSRIKGHPFGVLVYWPNMREQYIMQFGTVIPINDPDYKENNEECVKKINTTEGLPKEKITEGQS